ncbi:hypothetical protein BaRGS_00008891 [Batillaria attramentaria]|uniref:Ig-like domain-containing protein n=1 Tax=Batillaria attramentaria TaxID=370345 RepID=A0ABD0LK57_9CAEN
MLRWYKGTPPELIVTSRRGDTELGLQETNVPKTYNNELYICQMDWAENWHVPFNLKVLFDPDRVEVLGGNPILVQKAEELASVTFTCAASDHNVQLDFSWSLPCAHRASSNQCTIRLKAEQDVRVTVTCSAKSRQSGKTITSNAFELNFHYPPSQPPQISGLPQNQELYKGDLLDVTCTVEGGKPPVSSVTLICQAPPKTPMLIGGVYSEGSRPILNCASSFYGCPPAVVRWSGLDAIQRHSYSSIRLPALTWQDNGRKIYCHLYNKFTEKNGTDVSSFTELNVHYAPKISFQPLDDSRCPGAKDGSCRITEGQRIHVNCSAHGNPAVSAVYWENMQPHSSVLDVTASHPPSQLPQISGLPQNQELYKGDLLDVTCTVEGGKPPVSSVTLICQGHNSTQENVAGRQRITTSLTFKVSSGNGDCRENKECLCRAEWPTSPLTYPASTKQFTVYSPPKTPMLIGGVYSEGSRPILNCASSFYGCPPAVVRWSGLDAIQRHSYSSIRLPALTWQDNGRKIYCHLYNKFTEKNGTDVSSFTELNVHYAPKISFQPLDDSRCPGAKDGSCRITEGQRIHVNCSAHGNPAVSAVYWENMQPHSSVLDVTASHGPNKPTLSLRSKGKDVANNVVTEHDPVTFTCEGSSRPPPSLRLQKLKDGSKTLTRKPSTAWGKKNLLTYSIKDAQCNDTGLYSCVASNAVEAEGPEAAVTQVSLAVHCSPRPLDPPEPHLNITFMGLPVQVTFDLTAYPLPNVSVAHDDLYPDDANTPLMVSADKFNGTCEETDVAYHARCSIWIHGVTSGDTGVYKAMVQNTEGTLDTLKFRLFVEGGLEL